MYSSETISRNMISSTKSGTMRFSTMTNDFKHGLEGVFMKSNKDMMVSDPIQQQQNQSDGGLMRYHSAPSSIFASLMDANNANGTSPDGSTHDEDEDDTIFSSSMNCSNGFSSRNTGIRSLNEANHELRFSSNSKQERLEYDHQENEFSSEDLKIVYENDTKGVYGAVMENQTQVRMNGNGNCSSNLIRQSSSPAGFFSGFDEMREVGNSGASNVIYAESNSTSSGLKNNVIFTSRTSGYSRFRPRTAENSHEYMDNTNGRSYFPGFMRDSWNDSGPNSLKRNRDEDVKMFSGFNGLENQIDLLDQNRDSSRHFVSGLTHRLSLPKTSSKMIVVEKFLKFQEDVVPCKIRAKRGCATHPRSIAERMRRKRISERMKKLQELFPDMDKQANTADMLDLAVEYIKDLQKQVQTLMDIKAKCACLT